MKEAHVFRFTAGERVLGTEPESGAEREMHYYVNDDAVAKLLGSTLDPLAADLVIWQLRSTLLTGWRSARRLLWIIGEGAL